MDEQPEDGILGVGTKWGQPEAKTPAEMDPSLIIAQITTALGRDPNIEVRSALANLPNSLLLGEVSRKLRGIAGQPANIEVKARQMRLDLKLDDRKSTPIEDLYDRLRGASTNMHTNPTYYTAIIQEINIRESAGSTPPPTPGPDDSSDTITLSLT